MATEPTATELTARLAPYGQTQLLRFWGDLDAAGRRRLADQITRIDWDILDGWIRTHVLREPQTLLPADLAPAPFFPARAVDGTQDSLYERGRQVGWELIAAGKVAGFTVAGGQGTRLGYDGPKGCYPIGPISGRSLFQLFADSILRLQERCGCVFPWYIMTSPANDATTRAYFEANDYLGLAPQNVAFLCQDTLPTVGLDGRVLLAGRDSLALSPNGHGGSLLALRDSGALDDMARRGIDVLSYWQVDNPLVAVADPLFVGLHAMLESDISCRALIKTDPFEKLGNFCRSGEHTLVIEYSDMPDALAEAPAPDGGLRFRAGSPAIHLFSRTFLERLASSGALSLPVHRAVKKVTHIDARGELVTPVEPNAVKLETFVFDTLPLADRVTVLEAHRADQFAPVKNATGMDSAESCRHLMTERSAGWLEAAGLHVPRRPDGTPDCVIELSPRSFFDAQDVIQQRGRLESPRAGQSYHCE